MFSKLFDIFEANILKIKLIIIANNWIIIITNTEKNSVHILIETTICKVFKWLIIERAV